MLFFKPAPNPSGNVQDLLGGNLPVVNSLHSTDARLGQTVFGGLQLVQQMCTMHQADSMSTNAEHQKELLLGSAS